MFTFGNEIKDIQNRQKNDRFSNIDVAHVSTSKVPGFRKQHKVQAYPTVFLFRDDLVISITTSKIERVLEIIQGSDIPNWGLAKTKIQQETFIIFYKILLSDLICRPTYLVVLFTRLDRNFQNGGYRKCPVYIMTEYAAFRGQRREWCYPCPRRSVWSSISRRTICLQVHRWCLRARWPK